MTQIISLRRIMLKNLLHKTKLVFSLLALAFLCIGSAATAKANGVVLSGNVGEGGTGFGNVLNILTLQATPNEMGSIIWTGSTDARLFDATNTSQTRTFQELINAGITSSSQLGLVYNVNQVGAGAGLNTILNSLTIQVFNANGTEVYSSTTCVGCGGNFPPISQGTGGAGYLFTLDAAAQAALAAYFANPTAFRIGLTANIGGSNDGPDNFYAQRVTAPNQVVPEPASMLLLGTGLVGVAGAARRRFKGRS